MTTETTSPIESFSKEVAVKSTFGVPWLTIAEIIMRLIADCFESPEEMENAARSLTAMQRIGLRNRAMRSVSRAGIFRPFQRRAAAQEISTLIEETAKNTASRSHGDVFAAAFEEAQMLVGS